MKRSAPLTRRTPLSQGGGIRRRDEKRVAERFARNFGDEADAVRAMSCLVHRQLAILGGWGAAERFIDEPMPAGWVECSGSIVDAHVKSRGAGGGRFDVVPLCDGHHTEQHQHGIETFAARYGLDLRLEADRVALEHAEALGIRGLSQRFAAHIEGPRWAFVDSLPAPLDTYERDALFGWVRRRMEREVDRRAYVRKTHSVARKLEESCNVASGRFGCVWDGLPDNDREALAHAVMLDLGEPFTSDPCGEHGLVWSLCEASGWPEVGS